MGAPHSQEAPTTGAELRASLQLLPVLALLSELRSEFFTLKSNSVSPSLLRVHLQHATAHVMVGSVREI